MKKKLAILLALLMVMIGCIGCKQQIEWNWPITIHEVDDTPEPQPPTCTCGCCHSA